jgi:SPP1 family predicted phage head-tail adaptor
MKQRIEIQNYTTESDGMGGTNATWDEADTVWANIEPVNGSQTWQIESLKGNISHVVTIRYRSDISITPESRFRYNGRVFNLKYVINKGEDSAYTKIAALEEV